MHTNTYMRAHTCTQTHPCVHTHTYAHTNRTASQVLLATLSIPIEPIPSETDRFLEVNDTSRDKAKRLSSLLRMATPPSRASLLKDVVSNVTSPPKNLLSGNLSDYIWMSKTLPSCLFFPSLPPSLPLSLPPSLPSSSLPCVQVRHSVLQYVPEELQQLYEYLEVEFNPLLLCKRIVPILEGLEGNETLAQYMEPVKEITIIRLIKQVRQTYKQTIHFGCMHIHLVLFQSW